MASICHIVIKFQTLGRKTTLGHDELRDKLKDLANFSNLAKEFRSTNNLTT
jgi:hypothetical protein